MRKSIDEIIKRREFLSQPMALLEMIKWVGQISSGYKNQQNDLLSTSNITPKPISIPQPAPNNRNVKPTIIKHKAEPQHTKAVSRHVCVKEVQLKCNAQTCMRGFRLKWNEHTCMREMDPREVLCLNARKEKVVFSECSTCNHAWVHNYLCCKMPQNDSNI